MNRRLDTSFFSRPTLWLAKHLLGKQLVRQDSQRRFAGLIVETEAYLWRGDPACHANRRMTKRNRSMFSQSGTLYVYAIHNHYCMNIVTEIEGRGAAVLIRALQPTEGIDHQKTNRSKERLKDLTSGPGKLCKSMLIDRQLDGEDLMVSPRIWIEEVALSSPLKVRRSARIGISSGTELPYRFFVDGNVFVSGLARDHSAARDSLLIIR